MPVVPQDLPHATTTPSASTTVVSLPLIASVAGYTITVSSPGVFRDPDTMWHVRTGELILENRSVPLHDLYSFSKPGTPWVAHEWLSELLMAWLHRMGGWPLLQVAFAVCVAITVALLTRHALRHLAPHNAVTMVGLSFALMASHLLVRPHVFVWPIIATWGLGFVHALERQKPPSWWLFLVLLAWTNLHGSFVLAGALAIFFLFEALWSSASWPERAIVLKQWVPRLLAFGAATLVNPQGFHAVRHTLALTRLPALHSMVTEWRSTDFQQLQFLLVWLLLFGALSLSGRIRLNVARAALVFGLVYLALKHERHHSVLGLLSPILLAGAMRSRGEEGVITSAELARRTPSVIWKRLVRPVSLRTGAVVWGAVFGITWATASLWSASPAEAIMPERALAIADSVGLRGRVLNHYNFGGYLISRGIPVFIDGRADMYGNAFLEQYRDAIALTHRDSLPALLDRYNIAWTLLTPSTPAVKLLDYLPGWQQVYSDSIAVIHSRQN
jgi:hypothetical protein